MGMAWSEFCAMTPEDLAPAVKAWAEDRRAESRERWEMVRQLACITIQPHCTKTLGARDVMRFPWDGEDEEPDGPTREEAHERYRQLIRQRHGG